MARGITTAFRTATESRVVRPIALLWMKFDSGDIRCWTGYGVLSWDGHDWIGTGDIGQLSDIEETAEVASKGASITVPGIPSDIAAAALLENYQGRKIVLYIGGFADDGTLINDPYPMLSGRMDQIEVQDGATTGSINLTVENRLVDLNRNRGRQLTHEEQIKDYPDDLGFEYVNSLQNKTLLWGNSTAVGSGTQEPPPDTGVQD